MCLSKAVSRSIKERDGHAEKEAEKKKVLKFRHKFSF